MKYELIEAIGLYFVTISNETYILDTGSPFSYFPKGNLLLEQKKFQTNEKFRSLFEKRIQSLKEHLEFGVDGIIGNDVLLALGLTIDRDEKTVEFKPSDFDFKYAFSYDVRFVENQSYIRIYKLIHQSVEDAERLSYAFDLGSPISLLQEDLFKTCMYLERYMVYYPSIGMNLEVDAFNIPFFEEKKIFIPCGMIKEKTILDQIKYCGVDGILSPRGLCMHKISIHTQKNKVLIG